MRNHRPTAAFSLAIIFSCAAAPAQSPAPRPLTLHVGQAVGAPSDVPGINQIDVALTMAFEGPVQRADVEQVALSGDGAAIPPSVLKTAKWSAPDGRSLRLSLALETILKSGLKYAAGTTTLHLECVLTLRGGKSFQARVPFEAGNYEGATARFTEVRGGNKPQAEVQPVKPYVSVVVTKPNPEPGGPFDDRPLTVPLPGARVAIEFERDGVLIRLEKTMPEKGDIRVEAPFDAPVTLKWEKETRTVTCTAKQPVQTVVFSTLKLKTVSTSPIR